MDIIFKNQPAEYFSGMRKRDRDRLELKLREFTAVVEIELELIGCRYLHTDISYQTSEGDRLLINTISDKNEIRVLNMFPNESAIYVSQLN